MSQFVEVKTAELAGPALDWAVAKACRYECGRLPRIGNTLGCNLPDGLQYVIGRLCCASIAEELNARFFRPSTDWAQGGPLIDKHSIDFNTQGVDVDGSQLIEATAQDFECMECWSAEGETRLIAACRAIVSAKFGDAVKVPVELVGEVT